MRLIILVLLRVLSFASYRQHMYALCRYLRDVGCKAIHRKECAGATLYNDRGPG